MLKIRLVVTALFVGGVLSAVGSATALANGGPHEQTFSTTTDACAGCHRAHTGQAAALLRFNSQYNLCVSCHDGSGANTAVTDGVYLGTANGTQNAGLKGGGFENALLNVTWDPSFNQTGTPSAITSKHSVGSADVRMWGSGNNTGAGLGETIADLECTNCHNPHGNGNYRMLLMQPVGPTSYNETGNISIVISGNDSATYTISYNGTGWRDRNTMYKASTSTNSTYRNVDNWCAQCHTRYMGTTSAAGEIDTGDPNYRFVHYTNLTGGCFTCHVAHGTTATMGGYAQSTVMWPGGAANQTWQASANESQTSRLLVANNRGACRQCHSDLGNK